MKTALKTSALLALLAPLALTLALPARADLISSRAALGGTDFIDWSQLGPSGTETAGSSVALTSHLGVLASLQKGSGSFFAFDSADIGTNIAGSLVFSNFSGSTDTALSIDFAGGVGRAGAQIQANLFGDFTARITAFNAANAVLESWTLDGVSDDLGGDTGIFIGIARPLNDIDRIEFSLDAGGDADFLINRFDFGPRRGDGGGPGTVPAPGSLALALLALATLGGRRRR